MKKLAYALSLYLSLLTIITTHTVDVQQVELLQPIPAELTTKYKDSVDELAALFQNVDQFSKTLVKEIGEVQVSFINLPFWAKARCVGAGALGAFAGNMVAYALSTIVGEYQQVKTVRPKQWGLFVTVGTLAGLASGGVYAYLAEYPSGIATGLDQKLITLVIKNRNTDDSSLLKDLNTHFALSTFPRVAAFLALESLCKKLTHVSELLDHLDTSTSKQFDQLKFKIETTSEHAQSAMVILKQDPHWLEEWTAHTVTLAQQNIQAHQQGQLVTSVIQFAHGK